MRSGVNRLPCRTLPMMKRIAAYISVLLTFTMSAISCSSSSEDVLPTLSISVDGRDLSGTALNLEGASSVEVDVKSNSQWRVACDASWVTIVPREGSGEGSFQVTVSEAYSSRSAVVVVSIIGHEGVKHFFDVIQRVTQPQPDNPNPENPVPNPDEPNAPDDGDDTNHEQQPDDGDGGDDDNPGNPDNPNNPTPPEDDEETPPAEQQGDYTLIDQMEELREGVYHIGGYQKGELHLATGGLTSVNHCNTAVFEFGNDGSLTVFESDAAQIALESADIANGYYIRFVDEGYLSARASGAGKLQFTDDRVAYWLFSPHEDGGFVLRQSGDIDVKLIISQNAQSDILRSIAGEEDANAVIFLKINNLQ